MYLKKKGYPPGYALVEYGESKEGYWTRACFMKQMERAVRIADLKSGGWRCVLSRCWKRGVLNMWNDRAQ